MPTRKAHRAGSAGAAKPQLKAWSYSRLRTYEECPRKAKYQYLDKLGSDKPTPKAMARGSEIHAECEKWLRSRATAIPESMQMFTKEFRKLRKIRNLQVEQQWAFTEDWGNADWFDTTGETWARIVVDAAGIITEKKKQVYRIIDFKTGKVREENEKQLELYALAGFHLQGVDLVRGELWYLDQGEIVELTYAPSEIPAIDKAWRARAKRMTADKRFPTTPSHSSCNWCDFKKAKGGPCRY